MDAAFRYNDISTGTFFLSRKKELAQLAEVIREGRNAVLYEPPKTGIGSLVRQTLLQLKKEDFPYVLHEIDMMEILDGNLFLSLTERVAAEEDGCRHIVYLREFQNILKLEDYDRILAQIEKSWTTDGRISYLMTGSGLNAMKHIFEVRKYFYRKAERVRLRPLEERVLAEMIVKTFLRVGRVVEQAQAEKICQLVDSHPWYVWQIAEICYGLTKGYLSNRSISEAVVSVLRLHDLRFRETVDGLSIYQIRLLRAVFDGVVRLNAAETISRYSLNSSANVHRLKEALMKKEVITFDEEDVPRIIDPLFVLWLRRCFFKTEKLEQEIRL